MRRFVLVLIAAAALCRAAVVDLSNKAIEPLHDATKKATVLLFVRTDCPVSNRYAPVIQAMARKYADRVQFWLVYPGHSQTPAAIEKQVSDYGYHLPVARDVDGELVKLSGAETTPEAAVFNAQRRLIYHGRIDNWYEDFGRARSAPTTHELADAIQAALADKTPAVPSAPAVGCSIADLE